MSEDLAFLMPFSLFDKIKFKISAQNFRDHFM